MLIERGLITKEQLGKVLAVQHNTKYINTENLMMDDSLLDLLPEDFMRINKVIPVSKERGRLVVIMVNPGSGHYRRNYLYHGYATPGSHYHPHGVSRALSSVLW